MVIREKLDRTANRDEDNARDVTYYLPRIDIPGRLVSVIAVPNDLARAQLARALEIKCMDLARVAMQRYHRPGLDPK